MYTGKESKERKVGVGMADTSLRYPAPHRFSSLGRAAILFAVALLVICHPAGAQSAGDPFGVAGFDCSRIVELGIDKQVNPRAAAIVSYCGKGDTGSAGHDGSLVDMAYPRPSGLAALGGTDINLITGTETFPNVTQTDSATWGHGQTIVVAYTDSRNTGATPRSYCGASVSTDGGATFTRLAYAFNNMGDCYGVPSVFYSVRSAKWFIGFLAAGCGGQGYGQWESTDGVNWSASGCSISGSSHDFMTMWVDNNPASPYYGRQYATSNNFEVDNGAIQVVYSTDDGVTWTSRIPISTGFRRSVRITGSLATDGTVFIQAMDEGGGGLAGPRINFIYRSTDGGATWSGAISQGLSFRGPGRSVNGYFAGMYTTPINGYWREMGWGQPGVGPGGVVHYVYSSRPPAPSTDPGNIMYIRSTDNGSIWLPPIQLNTDTTVRAQWQPALAINAQGQMVVTWYDERNTTNDSMQRYSRVSLDNGLTWGPETPISDVVFPKPLQPDPFVQTTYVGFKHQSGFSNNNYGNIAYATWTDGRISINGSPQQDVFFDKVNLGGKAIFDFDGDGKTDIGIFRPAVAEWWITRSSNAETFATRFGAATDRIVPADFTGDGRTDIAVWRPSEGRWYVLRSQDSSFFAFPFGTTGDVPVPADFDGDNIADAAVFRPSNSTWYINSSSNSGTTSRTFGAAGDIPVPGDYDGDGRADIAIYRPSVGEWWLERSTAGVTALRFGNSIDKPVPGDFTGDGKTDVAFWRPSIGNWFVLRSEDHSFFSFPFGANGDVPAPGDYDGDGKIDPTVFRPSTGTWYSQRSTAGILIRQFGVNGDRAVASAFVP